VTTDAEDAESESIDEEKREQRKIISEAMEKNQERSWSFWEVVVIYNSSRLTPAGKDAVRWARGTLQRTLGDDFLQKVAEAPSRHPIFDFSLGLAYDLPQAYANLFQLAAEIELLQSSVGWGIVHDSLRRDFQKDPWGSPLLQLEVAGLGLKAGWQIELERPLPNGGKTDVVLAKEATKILVETKAMFLAGPEQASEAYFYQLIEILQALAWKYGVRITSDNIGPPLPSLAQTQWIEMIMAAASKTEQDGESRVVQGPRGGQVKIIKEVTMPGISPLAGSPVETDIGRRLFFLLRDKNEQYEGAGPAWVRLGDYSGLWESSSLQGKSLLEKLDSLTPYLQARLAFFPNLAGVIMSPGKEVAGNTPIEPLNAPIERNGAFAVSCLMPERNQKRESIIVSQIREFTEQARMFANWYQQERSWLNWALKKLGKPAFDELVHLSK